MGFKKHIYGPVSQKSDVRDLEAIQTKSFSDVRDLEAIQTVNNPDLKLILRLPPKYTDQFHRTSWLLKATCEPQAPPMAGEIACKNSIPQRSPTRGAATFDVA
ncbi:hypothetical protein J6590_068111 [Homalodisca vitripennis]|nr:hypothetical protein J6590_068111 [Homalodisca vitripennis]